VSARAALPGHYAAALWLNAVMIAVSLAMMAVPVMAPTIAASLGVDAAWLGGFLSLMWVASLASSLGAGAMIQRWGSIRVCQLCMLAAGLGLATAIAAGSTRGMGPAVWITLMLLASLLIGLGMGAETPASSFLLARVTPPAEQPFVFSLKQTGVQAGGVIAGFLYPWLLTLTDWRGAMAVTLALLVALGIVLESPRKRFDPASPQAPAHGAPGLRDAITLVLRHPMLLRLAVASFAYIGTQIALNAFLVSYLVADLRLGLAEAGMLLAAAQAGGLVGRLGWGAASGRLMGARGLLTLIGVVMAVCSLALGLAGPMMPTALLAVVVFVFGMTASGWNGVFLAEVARLSPPGQVGRVTGAVFLIGTAGLIIAPPAFSAMASRWDYGAGYLMMAVWAAAGVLVMMPGRHGKRA
jgi:MFS family permease